MKTKNNILIHLFTAVVLSLVINFSYLLLPIITDRGMEQSNAGYAGQDCHSSGVLHLSPDMHGYIICDCELRDSTYVTAWQVRTMKLQQGDKLVFTVRPPQNLPDEVKGAHPRLDRVVQRNGEKFDLDMIYDRPSRTVEFVWQITYYAILSFLLICIFVIMRARTSSMALYLLYAVVLALAVTAVAIYFAPVMTFKDGVMRMGFFFESSPRDNIYLVVLTKA